MARKYDLIALDLDHTTLRDDSTLDPVTREALVRASEAGIEIVVASGRAYTSLPEEVMSVPGIRYAITSNGTEVIRVADGVKVKSFTLPEEAVRKTEAIVYPHRDKAAIEVFIDSMPYTGKVHWDDPTLYGCHPDYVPYVQQSRVRVEDIYSFIDEHAAEVDSLDVACPYPELQEEIRAQLRQIPGVRLTSSIGHLTEMVHKDAGKGAGLQFVCETLGIPQERTVAAGDADNDIDMMRWAGLGVAVANGSPNCLAAADRVIGSNDDNSVAKLIREIIG